MKEGFDVVAVLKESSLSGLIQIMESGQFEPAPEQGVNDGENIVGELTLFEKALYTLRNRTGDRANELARENNDMVMSKNGEVDRDVVKSNKLAHSAVSRMYKALDKLFWASINGRIPAAAESSAVGIRANYQIVAFESEDDGISLGDLLGSGSGRGMTAVVSIL